MLLFLVLGSCKKEKEIAAPPIPNTNYGTKVAQEYLNKAKTFYLSEIANSVYAQKNVKDITLDWENFKFYLNEKKERTIAVSFNNPLGVKVRHSVILLYDSVAKSFDKAYFLKYLPSKAYFDVNKGKTVYNNFNGHIEVYNPTGKLLRTDNIINAQQVKNGFVTQFDDNGIDLDSVIIYGPNQTINCPVCGYQVYNRSLNIFHKRCPQCNFCIADCNTGGNPGGATPPVGGGSGGGPVPQPDPCAKAGNQSSNQAYKNKASELKGKANLKYESGYEEKKNGTYDPLANSNSDALKASPTNDTKGYIHNHVDDYETGEFNVDGLPIVRKPIKMFSPGDVNTLMNLVDQNRNSGDFSEYYVSMVTSSYGHYMLKFTGTANDIQTNFGGLAWANEYKKFMKDYGNLEKGFLLFMKDKMGVKGVELFEIKNNGTTKGIKLKPDGKTVDKKKC